MVLGAVEIMDGLDDTDYALEARHSGAFSSPFAEKDPITHNVDCNVTNKGEKSGTKVDFVKKALSVQEKNKQAQKRFRDRQKAKVKELTDKLECAEQVMKQLSDENEYLRGRAKLLEKARVGTPQESGQCFVDGRDSAQTKYKYKGIDASIRIANADGDDCEINSKECQATGLQNRLLTSCWRNLVRELNTLLIQHENARHESDELKSYAGKSICHAMQEGVEKFMGTLRAFPHVLKYMPVASFDNAEEARSFWRKVVTRMDMKKVQVRDLGRLQDMYNDRMVHRRLQHKRTLQALQQTGSKSFTSDMDGSIRDLQAYIQSDRQDYFDCWNSAFATILDPVQKAHCIVQSYPFYPDMREIASIAMESPC